MKNLKLICSTLLFLFIFNLKPLNRNFIHLEKRFSSLRLEPATPCFAENIDEYYNRAKFYYGIGRYEEAINELKKALEIDPDNIKVRRLYEIVVDELRGREPELKEKPVIEKFEKRVEEKKLLETKKPEKVKQITAGIEKTEILGDVTKTTKIPGVVAIEAFKYKDVSQFVLTLTGEAKPDVKSSNQPPWIIIDLPGIYDALPAQKLEWNLGNVIRIRHSRFKSEPEPVARIVFDLKKSAENYTVKQEKNKIYLSVPDDPKAQPIPVITALEKRREPQLPKEEIKPRVFIEKLAGEGQDVRVNSKIGVPIILRLRDTENKLVSKKTVYFIPAKGLIIDADPIAGGLQDYTYSDEGGIVKLEEVRTTSLAGPSYIDVKIGSTITPEAETKIKINVIPEEPYNITLIQGDELKVFVNTLIDSSLIAGVEDKHGNVVSGVPITFEVVEGDAYLLSADDAPDVRTLNVITDIKGEGSVYKVRTGPKEGKVRIKVYSPLFPNLKEKYFNIENEPLLISMNFYNTPLLDIIRFLADYAGWNIIVSDAAIATAPEVTIHLENMNVREALDHILEMKNLTRVETEDGLTKIVTKTEALQKALPIIKEDEVLEAKDNMVTRVFSLKYSNATELAAKLSSMISDGGTVIDDSKSNSLIITDIASNIKRIEEILNMLDQFRATGLQLEINIVHLKNMDAQQVVTTLNNLLGQIKTVETTVEATARRVSAAERTAEIKRPERKTKFEVPAEISQNVLSLQPELIRLEALPQSNSILVLAPHTSYEQLKSLIERMESEIAQYAGLPTIEPKIYNIKNGQAADFSQILSRVFPNSIILSIKSSNQVVIISKTENELRAALTLLEALDVKQANYKYIERYNLKYADPDKFLQMLSSIFDIGTLRSPEVYIPSWVFLQKEFKMEDIEKYKKLMEKDVIAVPISEPPSLVIYANTGYHSQIKTLIDELDKPEFTKIGQLSVESFKVENANIFAIDKMIKPLLSENGLTFVFPENKSITVIDLSSKLDDLEEFIKKVDVPQVADLSYKIFYLKNASARDFITSNMEEIFLEIARAGKENVEARIIWWQDANYLIIFGDPEGLGRVGDIIKQIDEQKGEIEFKAYYPKTVSPTVLEQTLTKFPVYGGWFISDDNIKAVLLFAKKGEIEKILKVVQELDAGKKIEIFLPKTTISTVMTTLQNIYKNITPIQHLDKLVVLAPAEMLDDIRKTVNELEAGKKLEILSPRTNISTVMSTIQTLYPNAILNQYEDKLLVLANPETVSEIKYLVDKLEASREIEVFEIYHRSLSEIQTVLQTHFPSLTITTGPGHRLVIGAPSKKMIDAVSETIKALDSDKYRIIYLKNATASNVQTTLTDLFPGINFFALDQQNAVAFIDDEKIYTKIADVVKELDTNRVTVVRKLKFVQPAD
ncbi:MAG: secretin N-terminal domain-containing protein, partial [Candidatus Hydrogenedentota bacterium]